MLILQVILVWFGISIVTSLAFGAFLALSNESTLQQKTVTLREPITLPERTRKSS